MADVEARSRDLRAPFVANEPERVGRIAGVILAAGMSTRLGRPKQLLEIGGKPLIAHVADAALGSRLDEVIVVLGHQAGAVRNALRDRAVRICVNPQYEEGQSTSLIAALDAVAESTDGTVILLADQPTIATPVIDDLIETRRATRSPIVMTSYGGAASHPILFGRELFGEIRSIRGDRGARDVIRRHQDKVVTVDGGGHQPPPDVDTEEAYDLLRKTWTG